jgi:hypothetical protein
MLSISKDFGLQRWQESWGLIFRTQKSIFNPAFICKLFIQNLITYMNPFSFKNFLNQLKTQN